MKYCQFEALRFPDDLSTCRICGRPLVDAAAIPDLPEDVALRLATSCCPSPVCEASVAPSRTSFCAACGTKLEPISFDLWMDKFVAPAWDDNPAQLLVDSMSVLRPVSAMGLSRATARERLDRFLERQVKVPRATLDSWLDQTNAALKDGQKQEAGQSVAVREAKKLGIEVPLAMAVVEMLVQRIDGGVHGDRQGTLSETRLETWKKGQPRTRVVPLRKKAGLVASAADKSKLVDSDGSAGSCATEFPMLVAHCLRANGKGTVLKGDFVNDLLVSDPTGKGELVLMQDTRSPGKPLFVIPRIEQFVVKQEFHVFLERYYDCASPVAGELCIVAPAVVSQVAGGWKLLKKGLLEVGERVIRDSRAQEPLAATRPFQADVVPAEKEPITLNDSRPGSPGRLLKWLLVVGGIATLVICSGTYLMLKRSPEPAPTNVNASGTPRLTAASAPMVSLLGGTFPMGSDDGDEYERPRRNVTVPGFYMDVHEVTNQQYAEFVKANGHAAPPTWPNGVYPPGAALQPVTGVDWFDANAYAVWAKKRLPTEEEWEFAARGTAGWKYPWGNEWRANAANAGDLNARHLVNVGSYPGGKTAAGVMDLIGNAWEWTASDLNPYPGGQLASRPVGVFKVIRGGSWRESAQQATNSYRGYLPPSGAADYSATGFRCVQDLATASKSSPH